MDVVQLPDSTCVGAAQGQSDDVVPGDEGEALMAAMTIGRALAARRRDTGLDQEAAAAHLVVSLSTYASYERGTRRPPVEKLRAVADFLDVTTDAVLDLYGATCVEQARRVVQPDSADSGSPTSSRRTRAARRHEVSVIERVYFDATGANGVHAGVAVTPTAGPLSDDVAFASEVGDAATVINAHGDEARDVGSTVEGKDGKKTDGKKKKKEEKRKKQRDGTTAKGRKRKVGRKDKKAGKKEKRATKDVAQWTPTPPGRTRRKDAPTVGALVSVVDSRHDDDVRTRDRGSAKGRRRSKGERGKKVTTSSTKAKRVKSRH